jgi:carbon-monoxide dehydrogenase medium subunit
MGRLHSVASARVSEDHRLGQMRRFHYFEPRSFEEAGSLLRDYQGSASILAGGTDLLVEMRERLRRCEHVIDIKKIPAMTHLDYDDRRGLRFGALVTTRELETASLIHEKYPALQQALRELGSIQVRNRATVAGNICRASPSADTLPPLVAAGAQVRMRRGGAERTVALEDFFTGPGRTVLAPDEIVSEIVMPPPQPGSGSVYIKHGRRKAMELATVGVAVMVALDDAICREVRIVLGAVAPTVIRARRAEESLHGRPINEESIAAAADIATDECRPISNVRSSAEYRREMVGVLSRRALRQAVEVAR